MSLSLYVGGSDRYGNIMDVSLLILSLILRQIQRKENSIQATPDLGPHPFWLISVQAYAY